MSKISSFNWLALSFLGYHCINGVFTPFFPVWLKYQNYGAEIIGFILAFSYLFRFVGGMFFSSLIKQAAHLLTSVRALAWLSLIAMLAIGFFVDNFWLLCAAIWLFTMLNGAGMPISDTLAATWQRQINLDYGKVRLLGSAAYTLGVVFFGYIIGIIGEAHILWILIVLLICYSLVQMLNPAQPPVDTDLESQEAHSSKISYLSLLKNKTSLRLIIAVALIQGSHAAYYVYAVLYWTSIGISVQTTSLLLGLAVIAEILLFFFSTRLFQFCKISSLFYISAIATGVRWLLLANVESLIFIAFLQLFHSLSYAVNHYAMVRYITTQPQSHMAKLQALYNGMAGCCFMALFTALSGVIYPISPSLMFVAMACFALLAIPFIPPKVEAFLLKRIE